jgi:hypothetical protein
MKSRSISLLLLGALGPATLLVASKPALSEEPQLLAATGGVEVLARGPVHEAYAEPVDPYPQASPVIPKQPPEGIEELPPDQKPEGANVQWVPGYWAWDVDRNDYIWVSGFWRAPPPGRQWVPGHWQQVAGGCQWVPGFWSVPQRSDIEYAPPPPASLDAGPSVPSPGDGYMYQPGCWIYREARYAWQPGFWCECRPDWVWVPSHWIWTPCGCIFVPGYWDYPLHDRGLLFAPVCFERPVYLTPHFCYTPSCVVLDNCLLGCLFVRPQCCHYYFGDYFESRYQGLGFCPWVDFHIGHHCGDPLFSFYAGLHRAEPAWEANLRGLYVGRRNGTFLPPPRTLHQQLTQDLAHSGFGHGGPRVAESQHARLLSPLDKVAPHVLKLERVSPERRVQEQRDAARFRELGHQRHQVEAQLLTRGPAPVKPADGVQRVKLELPRAVQPKAQPAIVRTPPPPSPHLDLKPLARTAEPVRHHVEGVAEAGAAPRRELPPPPAHHEAVPTLKREVAPPPPEHHPAPPPPPPKQESPPHHLEAPAPVQPRVEPMPPPPVARHAEAPPPPQRPAPPPPPPQHMAPPPPAHHPAPPPAHHERPKHK